MLFRSRLDFSNGNNYVNNRPHHHPDNRGNDIVSVSCSAAQPNVEYQRSGLTVNSPLTFTMFVKFVFARPSLAWSLNQELQIVRVGGECYLFNPSFAFACAVRVCVGNNRIV